MINSLPALSLLYSVEWDWALLRLFFRATAPGFPWAPRVHYAQRSYQLRISSFSLVCPEIFVRALAPTILLCSRLHFCFYSLVLQVEVSWAGWHSTLMVNFHRVAYSWDIVSMKHWAQSWGALWAQWPTNVTNERLGVSPAKLEMPATIAG